MTECMAPSPAGGSVASQRRGLFRLSGVTRRQVRGLGRGITIVGLVFVCFAGVQGLRGLLQISAAPALLTIVVAAVIGVLMWKKLSVAYQHDDPFSGLGRRPGSKRAAGVIPASASAGVILSHFLSGELKSLAMATSFAVLAPPTFLAARWLITHPDRRARTYTRLGILCMRGWFG
jgi:hypothetical protein